MTGKYAAEWADALADVAEAGSPITFSKTVAGTFNPSTGDSAPPTTQSVTGKAIRTKGNPDTYLALGLIEAQSPTLFFVPDVYGVLPQLGMSALWGGTTYNVADGGIDPLDLDGKGAIAARIVVKV